jgi:hypothetical protein
VTTQFWLGLAIGIILTTLVWVPMVISVYKQGVKSLQELGDECCKLMKEVGETYHAAFRER